MLLKNVYMERTRIKWNETLIISADIGLLVKEQKAHEMKYSMTTVIKPTAIAPKYGAGTKYLKYVCPYNLIWSGEDI